MTMILPWLKKAWQLLKLYWKIPVTIIITIIVWRFLNPEAADLSKILEDNRKKHQEELDRIRASYQNQLDISRENNEKLKKILDEIEKKYNEKQEKLEESKKKTIANLVKKYKDNPEELSKKLSEATGLTITENNL